MCKATSAKTPKTHKFLHAIYRVLVAMCVATTVFSAPIWIRLSAYHFSSGTALLGVLWQPRRNVLRKAESYV